MKLLTLTVKRRLRTVLGLVVVATAISAVTVALTAGESAKPPTKAVKKTVKKKKLTGSELYAINCNRCHPERYPTEWTPSQWKTVMLHMRVRANLPAKQAKEILKYLQEDAGN